MAKCVNHPGVETDTPCANCGRPFCDACLVEFMGQRYCGPCRDLKLAGLQQPAGPFGESGPRAGTGTVDIGGWLNAGWQIIQPDLGLFALAAFLTVILSVFSCGIVAGPMAAGMYMMCFARLTYGRTDLAYLWMGFRRFLNAFLVVLLLVAVLLGVEIAISLPFGISMGILGSNRSTSGFAEGGQLVSGLLNTVISFVIQAAAFFALPLVAARNVNAIDAFRASWAIFLRNPGGFLLTAFVFEVLRRLGGLACCVGVFVTIPWIFAAQVKAFSEYFSVEGWEQVI